MVCFCDIPVADLPFHSQKYSPFGIAFKKSFLVKQGAAPVIYVPKGSPLHGKPLGTLLDEAGKEWEGLRNVPPEKKAQMGPLDRLLDYFLLSYLKPFDETKTEDDVENFYMEREWRTLNRVRFELDDVQRVIIPESYRRKLREKVPLYTGEVTFSRA